MHIVLRPVGAKESKQIPLMVASVHIRRRCVHFLMHVECRPDFLRPTCKFNWYVSTDYFNNKNNNNDNNNNNTLIISLQHNFKISYNDKIQLSGFQNFPRLSKADAFKIGRDSCQKRNTVHSPNFGIGIKKLG